MAAAATASTTATTCSSSSTSPGPHRRRQLNDIERDAAPPHDDCGCSPSSSSSPSCCGGGAGADHHHLHLHHHNHSACCAHDDAECGGLHGHANAPCGGRPLLLARRKRAAAGAPGRAAWMRGIVLCLLGLVAVVGFLGSHRGGGGAATGGDGADDAGGGGLVHKVDVTDADVMGWTEENLTAIARRPPEPPVSKYSYVYVHGAPTPVRRRRSLARALLCSFY